MELYLYFQCFFIARCLIKWRDNFLLAREDPSVRNKSYVNISFIWLNNTNILDWNQSLLFEAKKKLQSLKNFIICYVLELAYEDENCEISNQDRVHNLITLNVGVHLILVEVSFSDGVYRTASVRFQTQCKHVFWCSSLQGFRTTSELPSQRLGRDFTVSSQ
jgi:FAD synthase